MTSCSTEGSGPVLLVSAGIGVTPLLAMLHRLADETSPREVWWIHTTHDAHTHAFAAEVSRPAGPPPGGALAGLLHGARPSTRAGLGHPDRAPDRGGDRGPGSARRTRPPMSAGPSRSWTTSRPRSRASASTRRASTPSGSARGPPINPGVVATDAPRAAPAARTAGDRPGGDLRPLRARHRVVGPVRARSSSSPRRATCPTQWSCRTGVCHTCVTAVLSGEASYDVPPLEAPGDDELLICSATPDSDLVVDL